MYSSCIEIIPIDPLNKEINSAYHDAFNGKGLFILFQNFIYGGCIKLIHFDIVKSVLNSAHQDASNGKGFFIIFHKTNIWRQHKNNKLRHSEEWSDFCSSRRFQR